MLSFIPPVIWAFFVFVIRSDLLKHCATALDHHQPIFQWIARWNRIAHRNCDFSPKVRQSRPGQRLIQLNLDEDIVRLKIVTHTLHINRAGLSDEAGNGEAYSFLRGLTLEMADSLA